MRAMVIGGGGLLGTAFRLEAGPWPEVTELIVPGRRDLDETQQVEVERYLIATRPDVVVSAAVLPPCCCRPARAILLRAPDPGEGRGP